eukprot:206380_1
MSMNSVDMCIIQSYMGWVYWVIYELLMDQMNEVMELETNIYARKERQAMHMELKKANDEPLYAEHIEVTIKAMRLIQGVRVHLGKGKGDGKVGILHRSSSIFIYITKYELHGINITIQFISISYTGQPYAHNI